MVINRVRLIDIRWKTESEIFFSIEKFVVFKTCMILCANRELSIYLKYVMKLMDK